MPITGKIAKFDDIQYVYYRQLVPGMLEQFRNFVRLYARQIQSHIQANMQKPKTGRVYWRPGKRMHIASAPGEAPAIDTGRLFADIKTNWRAGGLIADIGTRNTTYANFLEEGTRKMLKRPFAKPARDAFADRFAEQMAWMAMRVH